MCEEHNQLPFPHQLMHASNHFIDCQCQFPQQRGEGMGVPAFLVSHDFYRSTFNFYQGKEVV